MCPLCCAEPQITLRFPGTPMISHHAISAVFVVATVLLAIPAAAQDSRAAELAAQQADKATKLRPNTETGAEKA